METRKLNDTEIMKNAHGADARNLYNTDDAMVTADTLIESPRDIMHCWYNESGADLRFMVIKAPKPAKKTVFIADE